MAALNPEAFPFIPSASVSPLVPASSPFSASGTPFISSASPFFPSSALSPASQQVLAGELAALDRREARHARCQSEQQQWGDGRMQMAQEPVYMYQPQTFEEVYNYREPQTQYQAQDQMQYRQQYHSYEQNWIPSQYRIEAQQPQQDHEIRGTANQSFVDNQPERNPNYVGAQHSPQSYLPPAQRTQPLRQFWDGGMETTIYSPPPPLSEGPQPPKPPSMTIKQIRQVESARPTNEMATQAYNPQEMVQVRQRDNTSKGKAMAQNRASKQQAGRPVYVPHDASEYQQYEQPAFAQGLAMPYEQSDIRRRAVSSQLPVYVHKRNLGEVPGYEGYSITPERKIVRPDRVFAQVEETPVPAGGSRVRLPRAESSPVHMCDHNGDIQRFNSDVTPTRRHTDDGSNSSNRSTKPYNLANEFQQYYARQHTTARAGSDDGRYRQHQREFYNSNGSNANQSRELDEIKEEERILSAITREGMDRGPDRSHYSARNIPQRQQEPPAETLPTTNTTAAPALSPDNFHEGTRAVASFPSATQVNTTMTSSGRVDPTPTRRPTVEDLSFAPAATSPVRTYNFPYAPATSSGQPLNLPGPRTNPLSSLSDRVARGEFVPSDTLDAHNLATQSVISQMEANARAAAAGGRGEIAYMDRGKYWVERKKAGKNAWEMGGWKVGGERPREPNEANEAQKTRKKHKQNMDGDGWNGKEGEKKKALEEGADGECKNDTKVCQSRYDDDEGGKEKSEKW